MAHKRKRPDASWLSRSEYEIEHFDEMLRRRIKELHKIRRIKNGKAKA